MVTAARKTWAGPAPLPEWEPELVAIDCPQCDGSGGPPPVWDEDTGRSVVYVCSRCSGQGEIRVWSDDPDYIGRH